MPQEPVVYKTKSVTAAARTAGISDADLYEAAASALTHKSANLGGGIYKARINKNQHRVILAKVGDSYCILLYLLNKSDRGNITPYELGRYKDFAKALTKKLNAEGLALALDQNIFSEIRRGSQRKIQK